MNDEGWIVTAAHILSQYLKMTEEVAACGAGTAAAVPKQDRAARRREKRGEKAPDLTANCSAWWSWDKVKIGEMTYNEAADIGVAKLDPFDPSFVPTYPVFKDPDKNFSPGRTLCRLGYPFHSIQPSWDDQTKAFRLPPGSVPPPRFPLEGIFTRIQVIQHPDGTLTQLIETSSPGLRGQSGGPIFDAQGRVWGIQSRTMHLPLGFEPKAPGTNDVIHQFLNVGLGAHPEELFRLFDRAGVRYTKSED